MKKALVYCGIKPKRKLPIVNQTQKKMSFESYYNEENSALVWLVFGPYMLKHGMTFPKIWEDKTISPYKIILFKFCGFIRKIYWIKNDYRDGINQKVYEELIKKYS